MRSQPRGAERRTEKTFEAKLWDYLRHEKYTNWAPVPGESEGFSEGESPHGAFLKMYLNRTAAGNPKKLPYGSIVIKENYGPDQKQLMAVTVMYRAKGFNPDSGDWYWAKYNPDGTVAQAPPEMGSMPIAGKVGGCINCHSGAADDDFAFFNDGL
jgi:Cytochrome P460